MIYYLSLGSNLGDRLVNLRRAFEFLKTKGRVLGASSVFETIPVDMVETGNFYNAVVCLQSEINPGTLLDDLKTFEWDSGRNRVDSHLRPRVIDIDILLADDLIWDTGKLKIPHPRMSERPFVLVPLCEIAPWLKHPREKRLFCDLRDMTGNRGIVARIGGLEIVGR
jgi:2-amino-4-hydroxy-6-hydroxymethyldihydropteridine diphosphokinase